MRKGQVVACRSKLVDPSAPSKPLECTSVYSAPCVFSVSVVVKEGTARVAVMCCELYEELYSRVARRSRTEGREALGKV